MVSEVGALTREFYIGAIRTWKNYGGKQVWGFMGAGHKTVKYILKDLKDPSWKYWKVPLDLQKQRGSYISAIILLHFITFLKQV